LKRVGYSIFFFLLFGVLLSSLNYKYFVPKTTVVNYTIESSLVDTVEVFYNIGEGWSPFQKQKHTNEKGVKTNHEFIFNLNEYPEQIRFDFGTLHDTISLSNVSITNNAIIEFSPKKNFKRSIDIEKIEFNSKSALTIITKNGDPYIEFFSNPYNNYTQRFISLNWLSGTIIFFVSILISLLLIWVNSQFLNSINHLTIFFLITISTAATNQVFQIIPESENLENRKLAPFPQSDLFKEYCKELDEYLNDQFTLKPLLAYFDAAFKYELFGVSSQPNKVIIGKNDYLFPVGLDILNDYKHHIHFIPAGLQSILITLEERKEWLSKKGIPFIIVFAPNKQTVYPEYMASEYIPGQYFGRLDQLLQYIKTNSNLEIINLREVLLAQKGNNNSLFYKYDMHWNNLGGYYGYHAIMEKAAMHFPELKPKEISDFDTTTVFSPNGDQAKLLLLHKKLQKRDVKFQPRFELIKEKATHYRDHINGNQYLVKGKKLKLVMFHDSYGVNINPLISNHFKKSIFIWNHKFDVQLIEKEKPDIVIHEFAELFLPSLLTQNSIELKKSLKTSESN